MLRTVNEIQNSSFTENNYLKKLKKTSEIRLVCCSIRGSK
jgi:hypothetical protein